MGQSINTKENKNCNFIECNDIRINLNRELLK